ncbi:MAG TPA: Sir2 family NAD-dependent protein deacetylase [Acidimicrobiales bacterium]|nr:Sir2 family NAD-dependent protein deacetylase [Acidimicrobiales bacterium]
MIPDDAVAVAADLVGRSDRVVVLAGAGMSTDSGIADYRGPNGLWTKNPKAERISDISYYLNDPEVRRLSWQHRLGSPIWDAQPNPGHLALVELEQRGKLDTLITQNIDGLHHLAGNHPSKIVEIHGNARTVVCMSCDERAPMERALERVRRGEDDPACRTCGGILKSATISFGQQIVLDDLSRAEQAAHRADLVLAVGSTLGVYPAAGVIPIALHHGAALVIVNADPTPFDPSADAVVRGSISEVLPEIVRGGRPRREDAAPA